MTLPPRRYSRFDAQFGTIHRRWLKTFECCCWGNPLSPCDTDHGVDLAHYRSAANSGTGMKPGPEWLLPLCRFHHTEQHNIGQPEFERRYGFSMAEKAREFARQSPEGRVREVSGNPLAVVVSNGP